jgi:hypothetical protein
MCLQAASMWPLDISRTDVREPSQLDAFQNESGGVQISDTSELINIDIHFFLDSSIKRGQAFGIKWCIDVSS